MELVKNNYKYLSFIIMIFLFIWGLRYYLVDHNTILFTPKEKICPILNDRYNETMNQNFSLFVDPENNWNYELLVEGIKEVSVQVKCPSAWTETEVVINDTVISRTKTHDILTEYYIEDCHDKARFVVSTRLHPNEKEKFKESNFLVTHEIFSPKKEEHFGYFAEKPRERGFYIVDLNGKPIVEIWKTGKNSSLKWKFFVIDKSHPLADINLSFLLLGKKSFQKWLNYDNCNKVYFILDTIYEITYVFIIPVAVVIILIAFCKKKSKNLDGTGIELQSTDNICIEEETFHKEV